MKTIFITFFLLACSPAQAWTFAKLEDIIGCGTVVSVRNVDQAPLNDPEYQQTFNAARTSGDIFNALFGGGLLSATAALGASLVTDVGIAAANKPIPVIEAPPGGQWKHVKAVQIRIDDGREINLPLMEFHTVLGAGERNYAAGQRYLLAYSKEFDNIQIFMAGAHVPDPSSEKRYWKYCHLRADKAVADDIVERSKALVDVAKILPN